MNKESLVFSLAQTFTSKSQESWLAYFKTNFYALLGYQKNVTNMFKNRSLKKKTQIM